jgi:hypothetical protein
MTRCDGIEKRGRHSHNNLRPILHETPKPVTTDCNGKTSRGASDWKLFR